MECVCCVAYCVARTPRHTACRLAGHPWRRGGIGGPGTGTRRSAWVLAQGGRGGGKRRKEEGGGGSWREEEGGGKVKPHGDGGIAA